MHSCFATFLATYPKSNVAVELQKFRFHEKMKILVVLKSPEWILAIYFGSTCAINTLSAGNHISYNELTFWRLEGVCIVINFFCVACAKFTEFRHPSNSQVHADSRKSFYSSSQMSKYYDEPYLKILVRYRCSKKFRADFFLNV